MTQDEILGMNSLELAALTDAQVLEWAAPFLKVTRPPIPIKEGSLALEGGSSMTKKSAGFDNKYNDMLRKAKEAATRAGIKLEGI
jgi:hypothetical protein